MHSSRPKNKEQRKKEHSFCRNAETIYIIYNCRKAKILQKTCFGIEIPYKPNSHPSAYSSPDKPKNKVFHNLYFSGNQYIIFLKKNQDFSKKQPLNKGCKVLFECIRPFDMLYTIRSKRTFNLTNMNIYIRRICHIITYIAGSCNAPFL